MSGALAGIKVLDLSRLLPGNLCTLLLADLGADVLKVEEPGRGDYIRWFPPIHRQESYLHLVLNRNKRSLTLNLKSPEGREILLDLVRDADVVVESNRPGVMDRLGVGYEALSQVNPKLVYCAITGFGQDGPYRQVPGHDLNYMGLAGVLKTFGPAGSPPLVPGMNIADIGGGAQMAVTGILSALIARQTTGRGQFVDISMTDGALYWAALQAGWFFGTGESLHNGDSLLLGRYPCYSIYETADGGYLTVGCIEDYFWARLCEAIERPAYIPLQMDEESREQIFADLRAIFRTRSRQEWMEFLMDKNVCVGPVYDTGEAMQDPHLMHRQMFTTIEHPVEGQVHQLGIPIKLSDTPGTVRSPSPTLGEHTQEVLQALGYSPAQIEAWRKDGVI